MLRHRFGLLAAVVALPLLSGSVTLASEAPAGPNTGKITLSGGVDWTTQYMFRGLNQEDQGIILQPYIDLGFALYEGDGFINSVSLNLGLWNSIHSEDTGAPAGSTTESWYENDAYAALNFGFAEKFTFSMLYTLYSYPNDAYEQIQEFGFKLAFDDSEYLKEFSLKPYVLVAIESQDDNGAEDTYIEIGFGPSFQVVQSEKYPITLSIPLVLGMSTDGYYVDAGGDRETLGFASISALFGLPLSFIDPGYGSWTVTAGASFYFLGDAAEVANNDDDFQIVGVLRTTFSF